MAQQTDMFTRIALGGNVPMEPNVNGLFTAAQVAVLATKRGCVVHEVSDYGIDIQYRRKPIAKIMATDKGLWSPVNIFRGCREAAGQPHYAIDYGKAKIKNPGGLNEVLIAEVVGSDGVRPYLSRPSMSPYLLATPNGDYELARYGLQTDGDHRAAAGSWTWPIACIFVNGNKVQAFKAGKSADYRRAVRALDDAGLLKLTVGTRGGFGTATFEWLPAAYLAPIQAPKLDPVDGDFLCDVMALS